MEAAVAKVTQAISLDKAGLLEQSYDAYKEALALFIPLVKAETNPNNKASLTKTVTGYMQRAEAIKAHLVAINRAAAARTEAESKARAAALAAERVAAEAEATEANARAAQCAADRAAAERLAKAEAARASRAPSAAARAPRSNRTTTTTTTTSTSSASAATSSASARTGRVGAPPSASTSTSSTSTNRSSTQRRDVTRPTAASASRRTAAARRPSRSPVRTGRGTTGPAARRRSSSSASQPTKGAVAKSRTASRSTGARATASRSTGSRATRGRSAGGRSAGGRSAGGRATGGAGRGRARKRGEKKGPELDEFEERVAGEVLDKSPGVEWDDVAGLEFAKRTLMEAVILPNLRPDIFTGLRSPPKGVLLFGPPGTGKTLLAKAVATESKATFLSISAAALTSKWMGEGEKLVRAMFTLARKLQPTVVFIDEIDSLLSARRSNENQGSRRMKTEFLVQLDGATGATEEKVLVMGATNRPQELDDAVRRRLVKRVYIPLPCHEARVTLVTRLMQSLDDNLSADDIAAIATLTSGYSGSDLKALCAEAAMGPVRELGTRIADIDSSEVRPVSVDDFVKATHTIRASVDKSMLAGYEKWNKEFGSA